MISLKQRKILAPILFPLSLLYGLGVLIRNVLFDLNILKSLEFDFPVINVGNITVGGTGKTPHIEYLIELLKDNFKLGVLSRGYKRKSKGFLLAKSGITPDDIGDESFQIYRKYKNVDVAVDEKRVHGISELKKNKEDLQIVLLDDAFQHRYVKPGVSIVLIDYYRPVFKDNLLPFGELRDRRDSIRRAHIIIVTKVPDSIKPIEKRLWKKELGLFPYQYLYFTTYKYGQFTALGNKVKNVTHTEIKKQSAFILVVTGIANPKPMIRFLKTLTKKISEIRFPDHHSYSRQDLSMISSKFESIQAKNKIIVTTEKDAVKLIGMENSDKSLINKMYYLPVKVEFLNHKECDFDSNILNYVAKNRKINRLHK